MNVVGKIICRTAGIAGMGIALYDASKSAGYYSKSYGEKENSEYLAKAYANSRTLDTDSYTTSAFQKEGFNLMTKNPIPSAYGKVKGYFKGLFSGLADNIVIVASSSLALLGKGLWAKVGAAGVGLGLGYQILHNVFGIGKQNPMN